MLPFPATGWTLALALTGTAGAADPAPADLPALVRELESASYDARGRARDTLAEIGKAATPHLVPALRHPRWEVRWEAVNVLGYTADPEAVPAIVERVVGDDNPHVRWRALWALAASDPDGARARELLWQETRTADSARRWNAAVGTTMFKDARMLPLMHAGLTSSDPWVRWEAVDALGRIHDEVSSHLIECLLFEDPDPSVRTEAAMALGGICDAKAKEVLARAVVVSEPQVRWRAAMGLGRCADLAYRDLLLSRRDVETDPLITEPIDQALATLARSR